MGKKSTILEGFLLLNKIYLQTKLKYWSHTPFLLLITVIARIWVEGGEGRNYVHNLAQHVT